jgi:hypothetical protein
MIETVLTLLKTRDDKVLHVISFLNPLTDNFSIICFSDNLMLFVLLQSPIKGYRGIKYK